MDVPGRACGADLPQLLWPTETLRALFVAGLELLVGVGTVFLLVVLCEVLATQRQRVHAEFARQCVHGALERERALHVSRGAERGHRASVRIHGGLGGAHVGAGVHLVVDLARPGEPAADAHHHLAFHRDGRERAVLLRGERHALDRGGAVTAVDLLTFAIEHAAHRLAGFARQCRRDVGGHRRAVLRTEPAAHVVLDHAHLRLPEAKRLGEVVARVEDPLRGFPHGELVAGPVGHGAVGLQARVQLDRGAILAADDDMGRLDRLVHVAALLHARVVLARVPVFADSGCVGSQGGLDRDRMRQLLQRQGNGARRTLGGLAPLGAYGGDRLAHVANRRVEQLSAVKSNAVNVSAEQHCVNAGQ